MTECTLHNLLTSCQYPQVFWIYQMNDYDENILLTRRNSMTIANGNRGGHMNELKPGDINEDGKELEQDGWITVWTDEIEIPPTETSKDE